MRNVMKLTLCVLLLALVRNAAGETLYVNTDGSGGAYTSIQAAIDEAVSGEDQIEVAPGTYNEAINFNGKAIRLYSSGGPGATTIDATGWDASVVTCNSGEGADTMLEGFTIKGGVTVDNGGGMYNNGSSPTVKNCIFTSNIASRGGGMYNVNSSSPTVTNCTFSNNSASIHHGGGMSNYYESDPTVTNCTFSNNSSVTNGGGMYNKESNPTVTDCTFTSNTGGYGAGIHNSSSSPTVTNCTFSGNVANDSGGGMYNYISSSPTVTNCTFSDNTADAEGGGMRNNNSSPNVTECTFSGNNAGTHGGGMYNSGGSPTVTECAFNANTASVDGGGVYSDDSSPTMTNCTFNANTSSAHGGGMSNVNSSSPTVLNCTFSGNEAGGHGGGMINSVGCNPTVINCNFAGNSADLYGGGMFNNKSNPIVTNCEFSYNEADNNGGGMSNYAYSSPTVTNCILWGNTPNEIYNYNSTTTVTYSDVQGGWTGTGNINLNPMFADPDGRLSPGSPCIDAGDNSVVTVTTDLDGNLRIVGLAVDMGAYEFQEPLQHAAAKTQQLIDKIVALELPAGIENSLVSKLKNAIDSIQKAQEKAAVNKLEAFINEVEAQRGKKIPEADADALIALAQAIIDLIEAG